MRACRAAADFQSRVGGGRAGPGRDRMAGIPLRDAASAAARHRGRGAAGADGFLRRLRDHQHGGGRGFRDAADGDICHGAARGESGDQFDLGVDCGGFRCAGADLGKGARGMNRVVGQALSLRRPLRPPLLVNRRTFLMGVAGLASCARGRPRLNVYNWSNYVASDTVANFEREFGVYVRYATYESNEEMLAKVLGGNSGWDVVFPSHNRIPPMRQYGLLARLDHARLPNLPNLEPRFQIPPWDPRLEYCGPYMWGAPGVADNQSVAPAPAAWADLWSARFKGRLTMLDDPEEVLGACLLKLRLSYNSTDDASLRRAEHEAIAQKPLLRAYLNAEFRDQLVAGDILV